MRRLVLLVYAILFVNEVQQASIIPLLPELKAGFDLSKVETGAILSTTTFATVIVGVPVGLLADRVGARILTIGAGCLLVVSALVQAFADGFWTFLAGRGLLGLAYGTVWTAGLALIRKRLASATGLLSEEFARSHRLAPLESLEVGGWDPRAEDLLRAAGRNEEAMRHLKRAVTLFSEVGGAREPEVWKLVEW